MTKLTAFAAILSTLSLAASPVTNAPHGTPVLLELFTSEGCSSCPPADRVLADLDREQPIAGAELIVLSEHVDYWNHLGWADPFSSAAFSTRQRTYAEKLKIDDVYTPQLVVDGTAELVGSNRAHAVEAIEGALGIPKVTISISASEANSHLHIAIPTPPTRSADLYLALATDHAQSQVARGENAGRALSHVAVVYSINKVASGGKVLDQDLPIKLKPGTQPGDTRVVVFLADHATGRILGVSQVRL